MGESGAGRVTSGGVTVLGFHWRDNARARVGQPFATFVLAVLARFPQNLSERRSQPDLLQPPSVGSGGTAELTITGLLFGAETLIHFFWGGLDPW